VVSKKFTNILNIECYAIWNIYGSLFCRARFCIVMKIWGKKSQIQWWFEKYWPPPPFRRKMFIFSFLSYYSIAKLDKISLWMIASLTISQNWVKKESKKKPLLHNRKFIWRMHGCLVAYGYTCTCLIEKEVEPHKFIWLSKIWRSKSL